MSTKIKEDNLEKCFDENKIPAYLDAFVNHREQGLVLSLYKKSIEDTMCYWVCNDRSSDDIMVVIGTQSQFDFNTHCFNDDAFNNRKYFRKENMKGAVDYVYENIKTVYSKELENFKITGEYNNLKDKIIKVLKDMNYTYQTFYNFTLQEQNNKLYVVDELENFYYDGQDFDNCLEIMTEKFKNIVKDNDLYLDCEIVGRWEVVSDKLDFIMSESEKQIDKKGVDI